MNANMNTSYQSVTNYEERSADGGILRRLRTRRQRLPEMHSRKKSLLQKTRCWYPEQLPARQRAGFKKQRIRRPIFSRSRSLSCSWKAEYFPPLIRHLYSWQDNTATWQKIVPHGPVSKNWNCWQTVPYGRKQNRQWKVCLRKMESRFQKGSPSAWQ